jgi:hypothetical protein
LIKVVMLTAPTLIPNSSPQVEKGTKAKLIFAAWKRKA